MQVPNRTLLPRKITYLLLAINLLLPESVTILEARGSGRLILVKWRTRFVCLDLDTSQDRAYVSLFPLFCGNQVFSPQTRADLPLVCGFFCKFFLNSGICLSVVRDFQSLQKDKASQAYNLAGE